MMSSVPLAPHKHIRVLACVLCQHRKIKCDRSTPCSNCIKAGVTCTPSTPAPARKRRRPNQDLQERLARCEKLLQQYAAAGSPPGQSTEHSPSTPLPNSIKQDMWDTSPEGTDSQQTFKKTGRIVQEDGGARFMDSEIWATMSEELQGMRALMEAEEPDDGSSMLSPEEHTPDNQTDLLLSGDVSKISIDDLLPDPVHVFRLWQIFLDRVNPLTKIIHVPTLQPYIIDITSDPVEVPLNYQALLFGIFGMAVVSMTQSECQQLLGVSRERALVNFNTATKTSLVRFNFLKNFNMAALQALLLLMQSMESRYNRHAAWVLNGTIVRIAIKMGYHRDGEALKLSPFETEMRRRIWWQLLMHDNKLAALSGLTGSMGIAQWDTKKPLNLNDADLFPTSTEPIQARDGPTEMIFVLMMYEIHSFNMKLDASEVGSNFEAALLGQDMEGEANPDLSHQNTFEKFKEVTTELEENLLELENKYLDPSAGNVHIAALTIRPRISCHLGEILIPIKEHPEWGTEIFGPKDVLFKLTILGNEHRTESFNQMAKSGFLWFVRLNFQDEMFAVLTIQLFQRTKGSLSDRAWRVIDATYHDHVELYDMSQKAYAVQAQLTLRSWAAREAAHREEGTFLEIPKFITRLRDLVPATESPMVVAPATAQTTPAPIQQQHQPSPFGQVPQQTSNMQLDPFVGNYLDPSMGWDMLGDMMPNDTDQFSAAVLGGYGLTNVHMNSMNMGNTGNHEHHM